MPTTTRRQLAQQRPSSTNAVELYSPVGGVRVEIDKLIVCNTSGADATCRVFHDHDGTTFDESTALLWDVTVKANQTMVIDGLIGVYEGEANGFLGVRSSVGDALTFTLYGDEPI